MSTTAEAERDERTTEQKTDRSDSADAAGRGADEQASTAARERLGGTGRNDSCPCGSGKKYKKCHLQPDEAAVLPPSGPPDPMQLVNEGWRLFEQRRPGAAEKEFRAALRLNPDMVEARVGVGMAKLSAGETDAAREELAVVVSAGEGTAKELAGQGVKDGFNRREVQPYLRAAHALGCLAYDQNRFDEAFTDLQRVYELDEGTVGTEARLIAGKTLIKLGRAGDAIPVLTAALSSTSAGRARLGLALAHFAAGDRKAAEQALDEALSANPHFAKALLGRVRRRVDNLVGAAPGSIEEAVVYSQTYGDVWDEAAKAFLEEVTAGPKEKLTGASAAAADAPSDATAG